MTRYENITPKSGFVSRKILVNEFGFNAPSITASLNKVEHYRSGDDIYYKADDARTALIEKTEKRESRMFKAARASRPANQTFPRADEFREVAEQHRKATNVFWG